MKLAKIIFIFVIIFQLVGCAGIRGRGESTDRNSLEICVVNNPRVTVPQFEIDLIGQLETRGHVVESADARPKCNYHYILTYSALRSTGVVSKINLSLYEAERRIAYIDWDAGRSPMPPKISNDVFYSVEYWQLAEALAGLFGEVSIR